MKKIKQTYSVIPESCFGGISGIYKILKEKLFNKIQGRFLFSKEGQNNSLKTKDYKLKRPVFKKTGLNLGFTLVELIVVITILAILGTIAFVSFGSYSSNARDGTRISDLANISKGLEMYQLKVGSYPIPEGTILTGTINGIDVVYKGVIGENISRNIGMSKTPLDPLDKTTRYIYGISYDKTKYQVASILENPTAYYNQLNNLIVAPVFAAGEVAGVKGNYNQIIKFSTGATTKYWYIANVPSLVFNFSGTVVGSGVDLMTNKNSIYFVVNKNTNLPYSINGITNINSKTPDTIIQEITNTGTTYFTGVDITSIINATDATARNTAIETIFGTGSTPESAQLIRSFNINPSNLTTTAITSQLSSLVVGNIGSTNNEQEDNINDTYIIEYFPGGDGVGPCDTPNINLPIGCGEGGILCQQTWSACNMGAINAYNGSNGGTYNAYNGSITRGGNENINGKLYQRGRNKGYFGTDILSGSTLISNPNGNDEFYFVNGNDANKYDWINPSIDSLWGGNLLDTLSSNGEGTTSILRQGPCPNGWHIPSIKEWKDACSLLKGSECNYREDGIYTSSGLLLPLSGIRGNNYWWMGYNGYYWSSSPAVDEYGGLKNAYRIMYGDGTWEITTGRRAEGMAIRCIKN